MSTQVFVERRLAPGVAVLPGTSTGAVNACVAMYQAHWQASFLAADHSRMLCHFSAVDAESVRLALRRSGLTEARVWSGTVHDSPNQGAISVVVERSFEAPEHMQRLQAMEDAAAWCLDLHNVVFLRSFFASDRRRMLCLYQAPDAESVRLTQRQAQMPFDDIWACQPLDAPLLP